MRLTHAALWLIARIVPAASRERWLEEWRAELLHARKPMILGALPDAWALRRVSARRGETIGPSAGIFHAYPQDLKYAVRGLAKAPGFTFAAIASLSIGIAANTVAFSVVNAFVFRPFSGVYDQDSLARVILIRKGGLIDSTFEQYLRLRNTSPSLADVSAMHETILAVGRVAVPSEVPAAIVSANYFEVLGVQPVIGRFFDTRSAQDVPAAQSVVISHRLWQQMFAAAETAVGQWITVNGAHVRITGVAPRHFAGLGDGADAPDVWITFALAEVALRNSAGEPVSAESAGTLSLDFVGRLAPGATLAQAAAEISARASNLGGVEPVRGRVMPVGRRGSSRTPALMLAFMAVPLIVLAIACVNAANLMLARASRRAIEWRVRLALGSSRWRLIRQILTESGLLSGVAAAAGLMLTYWALRSMQQIVPVPLWIDWRLLTFTLATAVATGLVFGIGPAIVTTRAAARRTPGAGPEGLNTGHRRTRAGLMALQAALSLALLITGAQLTRTVLLANVYPVPDPAGLIVASFDVDKLRYTPEQAREFYDRLAAGARTLPGARSSTVAGGNLWGPLPFLGLLQVWLPADAPGSPRKAYAVYTAGDLFTTLGLPLTAGHSFRPDDHVGRPRSVIVNQAFADKLLHGTALGTHLRIAAGRERYETGYDVTVVGVVESTHAETVRRNEPPTIYYPGPVEHQPALNLFVRFDGDPEPVAAGVRELVARIDERLPVSALNTAHGLQHERHSSRRLVVLFIAVLGLTALVLAASGLFSVVSYIVAQRQREIGIRMTLGADGRSVVGMILRQALVPTGAGCVAGLGAAAATAQILRWGVHGAPTIDPVAFTGAPLVMLAVMIAASLLPARRATRVDPMTVLRQE
ncbi:MAG TPA: ABC transporter permease [Vicinamibacterales bacterium]|nr:ABC transporter permease [Vicinamibacterales bacterium]